MIVLPKVIHILLLSIVNSPKLNIKVFQMNVDTLSVHFYIHFQNTKNGLGFMVINLGQAGINRLAKIILADVNRINEISKCQ